MKWIYEATGLPSPNKFWRKYMENWIHITSRTRNTYDNEVARQFVSCGSPWLCVCFPTSPRISLNSQGFDFHLRAQGRIDASTVPPAACRDTSWNNQHWLHIVLRKVEV